MNDIDITQADREAAAREFARRFNSPFEEHLAVVHDGNPLVRAFARHRIEARAAALDEAAKVADEQGCTDISEAIRALEHTGQDGRGK